jgi:hypothetical protein
VTGSALRRARAALLVAESRRESTAAVLRNTRETTAFNTESTEGTESTEKNL